MLKIEPLTLKTPTNKNTNNNPPPCPHPPPHPRTKSKKIFELCGEIEPYFQFCNVFFKFCILSADTLDECLVKNTTHQSTYPCDSVGTFYNGYYISHFLYLGYFFLKYMYL